jgi:hypothetical protein
VAPPWKVVSWSHEVSRCLRDPADELMELEPHFDHSPRSTSAGVRKAKVNHCVMSQAVMTATGVRADGRWEVLGFAVGDSEDRAFRPRSATGQESRKPLTPIETLFSLRRRDLHVTTRVRLSAP